MDVTSEIQKAAEDEITRARAAPLLCPVGHPNRASSLNNLGVDLWNRFQQTGHLEDLDESIQLDREALLLHPVGHLNRASSLINLGMALRNRFEQTGHFKDLEESIQLDREALLLCPVGHPNRASLLNDLGLGLWDHFHQTGQIKDFDESIQFNRDALLLRPVGHPDRASSLINLGAVLQNRFKQIRHLKDLEESIQLAREALLLHPVGHPERALSLNNLGVGLWSHFQQTGRLEDLDEFLQLNRGALLLHPAGHPDRASSVHNLGLGLWSRFTQTSHLKDLDESIQLNREALLLHPVGHPNHASLLNSLSLGLWNCFQKTGHLRDLDESIQLNEEALQIHPVGHPDRACSLRALAFGLQNRFQQTGHLGDLDESICLYQEALGLHPAGHPDRAYLLQNLGSGLRNRFQQTGRLRDLDESIQLSQEALQLCPLGHPDYASSLHNLGLGLRNRFQQTGHLKDLDESIRLNEAAVLLHPVGHSKRASVLQDLGLGLWIRFQQTSHQEYLKECLSASKQGAEDIHSLVSDCLVAVKNWVRFTWPHHDLAQSNLDAYITGLSLISRSLSMIPVISLQYQHLSSTINLPEFVSDGASQAIKLGQRALAVEIIEQGRGLLWSELRGLRTPMDRLQALDPSLADELMQINHRLELLSTADSIDPGTNFLLQTDSHHQQMEVNRHPLGLNLFEERRLLVSSQGDIIEKIRKIPGFESFLGRKSFAELSSAAKHGPVVVVNCSRYRSDILLIIPEKNLPVLIPMAEGFYEEAKTLEQRLTEARADIKISPKRYNHVLQATLKDLWDLVVSPVVATLQELQIPEMSQIFWCPTSILSTLPLHAAGPIAPGTKKFLPDLYISSYTPTLTALITSFTTPSPKLSAQLPRLLVAGQYDNSLRNTKEEIDEVVQYKKHIPVTPLEEASTTKDAVAKALVDHDWLHIASHGTLVPTEPFSSYFSLSGGSRFTLLDIIRLNLPNASFAFLSACHTAEQPPGSVHDEVIHLAAAMQFCGFRSVVGTMWEMADVDGPEMVKDFYASVFSNLEEDPSRCNEIGVQARALAAAIKKMRGRKGVTLERWVNFVHIGA
ncbi:CHAT domain-containing protein [Rhodocollybia butyracea]|uniref:CHAT domain-containing protein n=1 Tax=Rhodocollybia butyracea TaxID=206335 RepID=A0A9P5U0F2_9AGAR|nr:CHAT domain-containing protein [Rhodocollybia butyracea]